MAAVWLAFWAVKKGGERGRQVDRVRTYSAFRDRGIRGGRPTRLFQLAGPALEDVVAARAFQVLSAANGRFGTVMTAAQQESAKADQGGHIPTYCRFAGITY